MAVNRLSVLSVTLCLGTSVMAVEPKADVKQDKNLWMTKKLELTQEILSALATEDYEAIATKAHQVRRLSTLEGWARRTDAEEYRRQLRIFQRAANSLMREAEEENIDGATLAFTHLTLSCVNCHKHLRSTTGKAASKPEE